MSLGKDPTPMKIFTDTGEMLWDGMIEYHSVTQTSLTLSALEVGEHTLRVQLGDANPVPMRVVVQSPSAPIIVAPPPADDVPLLPSPSAPSKTSIPKTQGSISAPAALGLVPQASQFSGVSIAGGSVKISGGGNPGTRSQFEKQNWVTSPDFRVMSPDFSNEVKQSRSDFLDNLVAARARGIVKTAANQRPLILRVHPRIAAARAVWGMQGRDTSREMRAREMRGHVPNSKSNLLHVPGFLGFLYVPGFFRSHSFTQMLFLFGLMFGSAGLIARARQMRRRKKMGIVGKVYGNRSLSNKT